MPQRGPSWAAAAGRAAPNAPVHSSWTRHGEPPQLPHTTAAAAAFKPEVAVRPGPADQPHHGDGGGGDDLAKKWGPIEEFLTAAASRVRSHHDDSTSLRQVRHKMVWYSYIYQMCSTGGPQCPEYLFRRLGLFILADLEENVLKPLMRLAHGRRRGGSRTCPRADAEPAQLGTSTSTSSHAHRCGTACGSADVSLCQAFCVQYRNFCVVCRLAVSVFSYLDQYYTKRYCLDSTEVMCQKIFYVVVYEQLKELLVRDIVAIADELRRGRRHDVETVRDTLGAVTSLLFVIADPAAPATPGWCSTPSAWLAAAMADTALAATSPVARPPAADHGLGGPPISLSQPLAGATDGALAGRGGSGGGNGADADTTADQRATPTHLHLRPSVERKTVTSVRRRAWSMDSRGSAPTSARSTPRRLALQGSVSSGGDGGGANGSATGTPGPAPDDAGGATATSAAGAPKSATSLSAPRTANRFLSFSLFSRQTVPKPRMASDVTILDGDREDLCHARRPPLGEWDDWLQNQLLDPDGIELLRERLESGIPQGTSGLTNSGGCGSPLLGNSGSVVSAISSAIHLLSPFHSAPASIGGRATAAAAGPHQQPRTFVVDVLLPSIELMYNDVGAAYVRALVQFYNGARETRLTEAPTMERYLLWVRRCVLFEKSLARESVVAPFYAAVRFALSQVLLIDVHRRVILNPTSGFGSLLAQHDRHARRRFATAVGHGSADASPHGGPAPPRGGAAAETTVAPPNPEANTTASTTTTTTATTTEAATGLPSPWSGREEDHGHSPYLTGDGVALMFGMFAATRDEACIELLASEFAVRVVEDGVALLLVYVDRLQAAESYVEENLVFVDDYLSLIGHLRSVVAVEFRGSHAMEGAMLDALREVINPDRWRGRFTPDSVRVRQCATTFTPSVLLNRDASTKVTLPLQRLAAAVYGGGNASSAATSTTPLFNGQELLAMYSDRLCRHEIRWISDAEAEAARMDLLVYAVALFDNRDVFLESYKVKLVRRLLGSAPHDESERALLQKLQRAVGRSFTHGMEVMMRDRELSHACMEAFRRTAEYDALPTKISVQVLTAAHWPVHRLFMLTPTACMAQGIEAFSAAYQALHPSRRLHWITFLATATLHGEFPLGRKEIQANAFQAVILVRVSDATRASAGMRGVRGGDLATLLGLQFHDIRPHLASIYQHRVYGLVALRSNVLAALEANAGAGDAAGGRISAAAAGAVGGAKVPPPHEDDVFVLNPFFQHKLRKFKLPTPTARARPAEAGAAEQQAARRSPRHALGSAMTTAATACGDGAFGAYGTLLERAVTSTCAYGDGGGSSLTPLDETRLTMLDAAIVRVMKTRRTLPFQQLLDLTVQQVLHVFTPPPRVVKLRVEDLVAKGYMARNREDHTVFEYVA